MGINIQLPVVKERLNWGNDIFGLNILNKIIKMNNDDRYKETLVDCKKQPCNECKVWDNYKS